MRGRERERERERGKPLISTMDIPLPPAFPLPPASHLPPPPCLPPSPLPSPYLHVGELLPGLSEASLELRHMRFQSYRAESENEGYSLTWTTTMSFGQTISLNESYGQHMRDRCSFMAAHPPPCFSLVSCWVLATSSLRERSRTFFS